MEFTIWDIMQSISYVWDYIRTWVLGGFSSIGGGLSAVISLVFVIFVVATYAFNGYQRLYMGRKAGVEKDWMAFVLFSRSLYRARIVGKSWWWMLLIGETPFYAIALFLILSWNITLAIVAVVLYLFASVGFKVYYRGLLFKAFGISPTLSLLQITFIGTYPLRVMDILIAFTRTYAFEGLTAPAYIPGASAERAAKTTGAAGAQQAKTGSITGLSGMYTGQDIPVSASEEIIIGRNSDECNIIITQNADKVSRKHCGILFDPATGGYKVTDYSSNGIFIDGGNRLAANIPSTLLRGSVIALGSRENRFRLN